VSRRNFSARGAFFFKPFGRGARLKVKSRAANGKEGGARPIQGGFFIGKAPRPARGAALLIFSVKKFGRRKSL
jgi:hypothetical protein